MMDNDARTDAVVEEKILPPHAPCVRLEDNNPTISWELPLAEFGHDNGSPAESLGFNHGHNHTMLMTTFIGPLDLREIRWYLYKGEDRHANFNVYIMGLDENGMPDPTDMLYMATGLDFTDNAWNSHVLPEPVRTYGCAVGINCDGFAGLGASASDADHPFESGRHFFAGDEYLMEDGIQDFEIFTDMLPMIHVCGERRDIPKGLETTRPSVAYGVYRLSGEDFSDSQYVGKTTDLSMKDLLPVDEAGEDYCYVVKAIYESDESDGIATDLIHLSSVNDVEYSLNGVRVKRHGDTLLLTGDDHIATLLVHSLSGQFLYSTNKPATRIDDLALGDNPVVVTVILTDGTQLSLLLK